MNARHLTAVAALTVAMLAPAAADATVLKDLSLSDLALQADSIVVGTVNDVRVSQPGGKNHHIFTDAIVDVSGVIKGKAIRRFTVRTMGGTVGNQNLMVAGQPKFTPGDKILLFSIVQDGFHYAVGMELGKYEIYTDDGGVERVKRTSTVPVAKLVGELMTYELAPTSYDHASLADFTVRIRQALAAGEAK